jgi:hypothetical protein
MVTMVTRSKSGMCDQCSHGHSDWGWWATRVVSPVCEALGAIMSNERKYGICTLDIIYMVVLGFEFRAWHLLGMCSNTWAMPPALFAGDYFGDPSWPEPHSSFHVPQLLEWYTCTTIQLSSIVMGSHRFFFAQALGMMILPISISCIVVMTGVYHCAQP